MEQARTIPIEVLKEFEIPGKLISVEELKRGHINRTYLGVWEHKGVRRRYVHQVVNHRIFPDIPGLMRNLELVTSTIAKVTRRADGTTGDKTLTVIRARGGASFICDEAGEYWRSFEFIEDAVSYDLCPSPAVASESAAILGRFQSALSALNPNLFVETIPFFTDGKKRYEVFKGIVNNDPIRRVAECMADIDFALERNEFGAALVDGVTSGLLPSRVAHNDMKLNNVLFDGSGERAICLLDLDTCMAGTVVYDFGDMVRNTAVTCAEDEQDLSRVGFDMELFKSLCKGYLSETEGMLGDGEVDMLAIAPRNLALILGVRFLTDYLQGDTYFRIHRSKHNLERARCQFEIVRVMERLEGEMRKVVDGFSSVRLKSCRNMVKNAGTKGANGWAEAPPSIKTRTRS